MCGMFQCKKTWHYLIRAEYYATLLAVGLLV